MEVKGSSNCPLCAELQLENNRLRNRLVADNISWKENPTPKPTPCIETSASKHTPEERPLI